MSFVHAGLAVAGLVAVALPIIIHLLSRRRRRPIEWGAMRFLIEAFQRQRRRLQVEQLLLLAVRCLIVLALGAALARPLLEGTPALGLGGSRAVFLVIDNGLTAQVSVDGERTAFDRHRERAIELIRTLRPGDAVAVITSARPARAVLAPPTSRHGAVVELLESLEPAEARGELGAALGEVRRVIDQVGDEFDQALVFLLDDFRAGSAPLESPLPPALADLGDRVRLLTAAPAAAGAANVQVTAVDPVRSLVLSDGADGSGQVTVRLARHGDELAGGVSRVTLGGDGVPPLDPRVVEWQPGQSEADVEFLLRLGDGGDRRIGLTASIEADALPGDNARHAVLEQRSKLRVVVADRRAFGFHATIDRLSAGQWIARALEPATGTPIEVITVEPAALDAADVRAADVAILPRPDLLPDAGWGALRAFVDRGGLLVITPPGELNVHPWVDHLEDDLDLPWRLGREVQARPGGLALADEQPDAELLRMLASELDDLAAPILAEKHLPVDEAASQATSILRFVDDSPFLVVDAPRPAAGPDDAPSAPAAGLVAYLAVSPELSWTNLPSKPLMVPLFHELVRQGASLSRLTRQLAVGDRAVLDGGAAYGELLGADGDRLALDATGRPADGLPRSGLFDLHDRGAQPLGLVAVNVEAAAGRTDVQSRQVVQRWLRGSGPWEVFEHEELPGLLAAAESGSSLAGLLLAALLALVIVETALARWFSHAHRPVTRPTLERWRTTIGETAATAGRTAP
ncbi:MAG: BatA domain-containing protein [Planctomycetota bacterium]